MGKSLRWNLRLLYWLPVTMWMVIIFTCSSFSKLPEPGGFEVGDKVKHFTAYAILAVLVYKAFRSTMGRWTLLPVAAATMALIAVYGASDEFHQYFIPGRSCDFRDWLADMAGAVFVTVSVVIYNCLRGRSL